MTGTLLTKFIPSLLALFLLTGCKHNPVSSRNDEQTLGLVKPHGTWVYVYGGDSTKIAFDSTSARFMQQIRYNFGFLRELPGNFTMTEKQINLVYDQGGNSSYWYRLRNDTLILGYDSLMTYPTQYVRKINLPSLDGWSTRLDIGWQHTYSTTADIWSYGLSDTGPIALTFSITDPIRYLMVIDTASGPTFISFANTVEALDATGENLWIAYDSTIVKRTVPDPTVLSSFSFRSVIPQSYYVTGLAVDANWCFIMAINTTDAHRGVLFRFTPTGSFIDSVETSATIKDLCLANSRLFCTDGVETVYELFPNTARPIAYYTLAGFPSGHNIGGIAFSDGDLQFANNYMGQLRLLNVQLPPALY